MSDNMLRQFRRDKPARAWPRRLRKLDVKAPASLGEVSVDLDESNAQAGMTLEEALRELEGADVKWYEDPSVEAGDWVQFEARMNHALITIDERHRNLTEGRDELVVFWLPFADGDTRTTRLLLMGYPDELVDPRPQLGLLRKDLSSSDVLPEILPALSGDITAKRRVELNLLHLADFQITLDIDTEATAMSFSGYARVAAELSSGSVVCPPGWDGLRYILANPLSVQS